MLLTRMINIAEYLRYVSFFSWPKIYFSLIPIIFFGGTGARGQTPLNPVGNQHFYLPLFPPPFKRAPTFKFLFLLKKNGNIGNMGTDTPGGIDKPAFLPVPVFVPFLNVFPFSNFYDPHIRFLLPTVLLNVAYNSCTYCSDSPLLLTWLKTSFSQITSLSF